MNQKNRILQQKIWLGKTNNFPFFAYLLFLLQFVESKTVPTIGVDGSEYCYYNPDFISKLNDVELRAIMIHEVLHIIYIHVWRKKNKDGLLWNISGDYIINQDIIDLDRNDIKLPDGFLHNEKYRGWFTEQVYADIYKNAIKINISSKGFAYDEKNNPCRGDHSKWKEGNNLKSGNNKEIRNSKKWQRAVKIAADIQSKLKGDLPAGLKRLIEMSEPRVDWRNVLLSYVVSCNDDYSYSRPDRRFLYQDFILPDLIEGEKLENVIIGIDASGSINKEMLDKFIGEVKDILGSFSNVKAWIGSMDTELYNFVEIDDYKMIPNIRGGGGTNYNCLFNEVEKRKIDPTVMIIIGDMYADFPKTKPYYEVIWLATKEHGQVPNWGRLIKYDYA